MNRNARIAATIGILAIFAILGAGTSGSDESSSSGGGSTTAATHQIGAAISLGDTTVTVSGVTTAKDVGNEIFHETAGANTAFVIVRYSELNNKTETLNVIGSPFKLRDAQGRVFDPSSRAESAITVSEQLQIFPQLQPGIAVNGVAAFEVPKDACTNAAVLVFHERGFLGSQTAEIPIDIASCAAL
jgi:hypothetical protein